MTARLTRLRKAIVYILFVVAASGLATAVAARQNAQAPAMTQGTAATAAFFEARIRPILVSNCFDCHTDKEEGELRVDSREALLTGGASGPAIVPGKPDESLLIKAVRREAGAPKMPKGRAAIKADDIDALVAWIKEGAPWPASAPNAPSASHTMTVTAEDRAFWSIRPLQTPAVPRPKNDGWARTDIDRFILARLETDGLAPVADADKLALIRRATLDLTGVPPTPEEVNAFLADSSATAFAKVVDRLLASPHYGETWGRHWLDVARYGEDDYRSLDPQRRGYNPYPNAYLYRDWVIKATNEDLPYDQFVKAQLAADLMDPSQRVRNLPALGFLGLGPYYYDNGAIEITKADERHDRVDAVGRGFLGLTVGCARCHDHKYDPIPTADYYAMAGIFGNIEYHEYPLAPKALVDDYKAMSKKLEKKQDLLDDFLTTETLQLGNTLAFQAAKYMVAAWKVTGEPKEDKQTIVEAEKLDYELFDRWIRFLGKPPTFYPYLKPWQEMIKTGGSEAAAKKLAADFQDLLVDVLLAKRELKEENDIIFAKSLPGTKKKEFANLPNEFVTNDDFCPGCALELKSLPIDRTNLWTDVFARDLDSVVLPGVGGRSKPGLLAFSGWGLERQLGPDRRTMIDALRADISAMEKALPEQYAYVHGVQDMKTPVNLKINLRGSPFRLGDEVPRGFLTVLSPAERTTFTKGSGRLELAEAIVAQPIAMRVIVNRVWKAHFGTGLVDTPSNFGKNGERPTHPELLEYLARYFQGHGMSLKALHREIMLSRVYQLSTAEAKVNADKDSGNRLYWRANRTRLSAEEIRDSVLFVSGSLDSKIGGPSVALTPLETRRTVYGRVSRYRLDEFLQLFDFPSPSQSAEKRFTTNVPLQRLFFMNSDFMQQQAERVADRVAAEPTDIARIQKTYRILFGRAATAAEVQAGQEFLASEPMRQYEERKAAEQDKEKMAAAKAMPAATPTPAPTPTPSATPAPPAAAPAAPPPDGPVADMMSGVPGRPAALKDDGKKRPVTVFGRYVKILLSSNEFLFVN